MPGPPPEGPCDEEREIESKLYINSISTSSSSTSTVVVVSISKLL